MGSQLSRLFNPFWIRFWENDFFLRSKVSWDRLDIRKLWRFLFVNFDQIKSCKWSILRIIWILSRKFQRISCIITVPWTDHISTIFVFSLTYHACTHSNLSKLVFFLILFSWFRFWDLNCGSFLDEILFDYVTICSVLDKENISKWSCILFEFDLLYSNFLHLGIDSVLSCNRFLELLGFD